jgi:UDPglucose 6-dehydrogenase
MCHERNALVIVTEWEQFRALDFAQLKKIMSQPIVVDLRNIYEPQEVEKQGFFYCGIGKGSGGPEANATMEQRRA